MLNTVWRLIALFCVTLLAACGGGGGDNAPTEGTQSISGQLPSAHWVVSATDGTGAFAGQANVAADGSYVLNVTGHEGPFIVQAVPQMASALRTQKGIALTPAPLPEGALYSYISEFPAADAEGAATGHANINALTTVVLRQLLAGDPRVMYGKPLPVLSHAQLQAATSALLRDWFTPASRVLADDSIDLLTLDLFTAPADVMTQVHAWLSDRALTMDDEGNFEYVEAASGQTVRIAAGVVGKTVSSLSFVPLAEPAREGVAVQLAVKAVFSDESNADISPALIQFSATAGALVSNTGVLTAGEGDTVVTASIWGKTATLEVPVLPVPALDSLRIDNPPAAIDGLQQAQLQAIATFADGSEQSGVQVSWSVNDSNTASISSNGLLSAARLQADATVQVTASLTLKGVTRTATTSILVREFVNSVVNAVITGPAAVDSKASAHYALQLTLRDGTQAQVNADSWTATPAERATVSAAGLVTTARSDAASSFTLAATYTDPLTGQAVSITSRQISINPFVLQVQELRVHGYGNLVTPQSATYRVTAVTNDGDYDVSANASWQLQATSFATLSGNVLTAANMSEAEEEVQLTVSYGGASATLAVHIQPASLTLQGVQIIAPGLYDNAGATIDDTIYLLENQAYDLSGLQQAAEIYAQASWTGGFRSRVAASWSTDHASAQISGQTLTLGAFSRDVFEEFRLTATLADPQDEANEVSHAIRVVVLKALPPAVGTIPDDLADGTFSYVYNYNSNLELGTHIFTRGTVSYRRYVTYRYVEGAFTDISGTSSPYTFTVLDPKAGGFVPSEYDSALGAPFTEPGAGVVEVVPPWDGSVQNVRITAVEDLSGKPVSSLFSDEYLADMNLRTQPGTVFGPGAQRLRVHARVTREGYTLWEPANITGISTLQQLVDALGRGETVDSPWGFDDRLQPVGGDAASGTVNLNIVSSGGTVLGTATAKRVTEHRKDMLLFTHYSLDGSQPFSKRYLAEHEGVLRVGSKVPANIVWDGSGNEIVINQIARSNLSAALQEGVIVDDSPLPVQTQPVAPGFLRVHWYHPQGNAGAYREGRTWGVYAWKGPLEPSAIWPSSRFKFTHVDSYGALVDIAMDPLAPAMEFLIVNSTGDASKFANCATDMLAPLAEDIASKGQEIWLEYGSCTIHTSKPLL